MEMVGRLFHVNCVIFECDESGGGLQLPSKHNGDVGAGKSLKRRSWGLARAGKVIWGS